MRNVNYTQEMAIKPCDQLRVGNKVEFSNSEIGKELGHGVFKKMSGPVSASN